MLPRRFRGGVVGPQGIFHPPEGAGSSTQRRQAPLSLAPVKEAQEAVGWEHANAFARYRRNSCAGALNALTKTPIARLREMERWLDTVNAMIEGPSLPKATRRDGIRAATAFRSRPRSQPWRGKLGTPAVAPAAGTSGPNAPDIHSNNLDANQGRLGQWTRHGAGAENPLNYPGFGRALEACGDQARPCWILPPCINLDLFLRSYLP